MRKFCGGIVLALGLYLAAVPSAAEEPRASIWPKLKADKTGEFKDAGTKKYLGARIKKMVSPTVMMVEIGKGEPAFLVRGLSFKEFAEDAVIEMQGEWKVTGTIPYGEPPQNYFIVEPVDKDKAGFALPGDEKDAGIWPRMKVERTGEFKDAKTKKYLTVRIKEVLSVNMLIAQIGKDEPAFIVKGPSAKEYADDTVIELRGEWTVTRTGAQGEPPRIYYIVEPVDKDKASFALPGDEKASGIWPRMKVGKSGEFKDPKTKKPLSVHIEELLSENLMLVAIGKDEPAFIVKGLPTRGLASGTRIELKGEWKVTRTAPIVDLYFGTAPRKERKNSYYVVEQVMK
jgi:hypothetical protein